MPVTKSAKKALSVAIRRHAENVLHKTNFKRAAKNVRKAAAEGITEVAALLSAAQSTLDRAAKNNTIHPNKAARLKSRLVKHLAAAASAEAPAPKAKRASTKTTAKGTPKKAAAKSATKKATTKKA